MKNKLVKLLFLTTLISLSSCKFLDINFNTSSSSSIESSKEEKETFTVKFNSNGGNYIPDQEVEKNGKIIKPDNPIKEDHTFINWTYQGEEWNFASYIVTEDMTLDANFESNLKAYERIENKIYFGEYPQTEVKDLELINELNTLVGNLPSETDTYNWKDYNYYIDGEVTSYMYYIDIDKDNDGTNDYRGVYFTQYRPNRCSSSSVSTYQDDNGYYTNIIYWFSYDKIEWNILKEENGKAMIIANLILDSQDYYSIYSTSEIEHNGGYGYTNNYELSNIRKFLNDNFYNVAFNQLEKEIINITEVDNSASSTDNSINQYACDNTFDRIFLLSYQETVTYYSSNEERQAKGSDYAKSQGLYVYTNECSIHWLRSPNSSSFGNNVSYVNSNGKLTTNAVSYTGRGIRPVCIINL